MATVVDSLPVSISASEQGDTTSKGASATTSVPLALFPREIAAVLSVFDVDGSGTIDASELAVAARRMHEDAQTIKHYRILAVVGAILFVLLSAANFAVSLGATSLLKDNHVTGSQMRALDGTVVQV